MFFPQDSIEILPLKLNGREREKKKEMLNWKAKITGSHQDLSVKLSRWNDYPRADGRLAGVSAVSIF